jgi:hypothetical protein
MCKKSVVVVFEVLSLNLPETTEEIREIVTIVDVPTDSKTEMLLLESVSSKRKR